MSSFQRGVVGVARVTLFTAGIVTAGRHADKQPPRQLTACGTILAAHGEILAILPPYPHYTVKAAVPLLREKAAIP
jgi:hypothetical protein